MRSALSRPPVRALLALACGMASLLAGAASAAERVAAGRVALLAGPDGNPTVLEAEQFAARSAAPSATFVVTYRGFTPAARAAFQRAVDIWATQITTTVPITVSATFRSLERGVLGSAGSNSLWLKFPGAPRPDAWYVDALANRRHGGQLDPSPDIVAEFASSLPNWHFGSGPAPRGKYDFTSVVLHELGHGLGFFGAGAVTANRGTVRTVGTPVIYDRFVENRSGTRLLRQPNNSPALADELRGGNLFFDSIPVRSVNRDLRARLHAPPVFNAASSYAHLDEASYLRGDPNSLMTPTLGMAETIRQPGPISLAILRTLGW